ncbi:MAG: hypothetical protein HY696_06315 [Deltaproteobacteria bacterium]|nr:hypothetical protein [Deltaproteobacteria bacterium]
MNRLRLPPAASARVRRTRRAAVQALVQQERMAGQRGHQQTTTRFERTRHAVSPRTARSPSALAHVGSPGIASGIAVLATLAAPLAQADTFSLMHPPFPSADASGYDVDGDFALDARTPAYCEDPDTSAEPPCDHYELRDILGKTTVGGVCLLAAAVAWYHSRWFYPYWKKARIERPLYDGLRILQYDANPGDGRRLQRDVRRARRAATELTMTRLWCNNATIRAAHGGDLLAWDVALRGGLLLYWYDFHYDSGVRGSYFLDVADHAQRAANASASAVMQHLADRFTATHALLNGELAAFLGTHPHFDVLDFSRWLEQYGIDRSLQQEPNFHGPRDFNALRTHLTARIQEAISLLRARTATNDTVATAAAIQTLAATLNAHVTTARPLVDRIGSALQAAGNNEATLAAILVTALDDILETQTYADWERIVGLVRNRIADIQSPEAPLLLGARLDVLEAAVQVTRAGGAGDRTAEVDLGPIMTAIAQFEQRGGIQPIDDMAPWLRRQYRATGRGPVFDSRSGLVRLSADLREAQLRYRRAHPLPVEPESNSAPPLPPPAAATHASAPPSTTTSLTALERSALAALLPSGGLQLIARSGTFERERHARIAALDATLAEFPDHGAAALTHARLRVVREAVLLHAGSPNALDRRVAELALFPKNGTAVDFQAWLRATSTPQQTSFVNLLADFVTAAYGTLPAATTHARDCGVYQAMTQGMAIERRAVARAVTFFVRGATLAPPPTATTPTDGNTATPDAIETRRPAHRIAAERFGRGGPHSAAAVRTLLQAAQRLDDIRQPHEAVRLRLLAAYFEWRIGYPDQQLAARVATLAEMPQGDPEAIMRWLDSLHAVEGVTLDHADGTSGARIGTFNNSPLADLADVMRDATLPRYGRETQARDVAAARSNPALPVRSHDLAPLFADLTESRRIAQVGVETAARLLAHADAATQRLAAPALRAAVARLHALPKSRDLLQLALVAEAVAAEAGEHDAPVEARIRTYLDAFPGQGPKELIRWLTELHLMENATDRPPFVVFLRLVDRTLLAHMPSFADLEEPATAPEAQALTLPQPPRVPTPIAEHWLWQPIAATLRTVWAGDPTTDPSLEALRTAILAIDFAHVPDAVGMALGAASRDANGYTLLRILRDDCDVAAVAQVLERLDSGGERR